MMKPVAESTAATAPTANIVKPPYALRIGKKLIAVIWTAVCLTTRVSHVSAFHCPRSTAYTGINRLSRTNTFGNVCTVGVDHRSRSALVMLSGNMGNSEYTRHHQYSLHDLFNAHLRQEITTDDLQNQLSLMLTSEICTIKQLAEYMSQHSHDRDHLYVLGQMIFDHSHIDIDQTLAQLSLNIHFNPHQIESIFSGYFSHANHVFFLPYIVHIPIESVDSASQILDILILYLRYRPAQHSSIQEAKLIIRQLERHLPLRNIQTSDFRVWAAKCFKDLPLIYLLIQVFNGIQKMSQPEDISVSTRWFMALCVLLHDHQNSLSYAPYQKHYNREMIIALLSVRHINIRYDMTEHFIDVLKSPPNPTHAQWISKAGISQYKMIVITLLFKYLPEHLLQPSSTSFGYINALLSNPLKNRERLYTFQLAMLTIIQHKLPDDDRIHIFNIAMQAFDNTQLNRKQQLQHALLTLESFSILLRLTEEDRQPTLTHLKTQQAIRECITQAIVHHLHLSDHTALFLSEQFVKTADTPPIIRRLILLIAKLYSHYRHDQIKWASIQFALQRLCNASVDKDHLHKIRYWPSDSPHFNAIESYRPDLIEAMRQHRIAMQHSLSVNGITYTLSVNDQWPDLFDCCYFPNSCLNPITGQAEQLITAPNIALDSKTLLAYIKTPDGQQRTRRLLKYVLISPFQTQTDELVDAQPTVAVLIEPEYTDQSRSSADQHVLSDALIHHIFQWAAQLKLPIVSADRALLTQQMRHAEILYTATVLPGDTQGNPYEYSDAKRDILSTQNPHSTQVYGYCLPS